MQRLTDAFFQLPEYLAELLTGPYLIWVVMALFLFLVVMFFNGRIAHVLRQICVLALAVGSVVAYFKRQYKLFWLLLLALVILLLYRLLVYSFVTIRQNGINRRIEKRALEKARMRRGARKRDFGNGSPADESSASGEAEDTAVPAATEAANAQAADPADVSLSRTQLNDAIKKLEDLKDAGVLTEEEFKQKKAGLYSRLG